MASLPIPKGKLSAGDPIPPKCSIIEIHVSELKQLFDAIDPSPFRDRDLDPKAEEFIVGWAKDLPRDSSFALLVDLDREAGLPNEAAVLRDAIHEFFRHRAETRGARIVTVGLSAARQERTRENTSAAISRCSVSVRF